MHILEEACAEMSLQARLKGARLTENLNHKLNQRPRDMELKQKNILPVNNSRIIEGANASCDEDSSDAVSTNQPAKQDSANQNSPVSSAPPSASPDAPAQAPVPSPPPPPPVSTGPSNQIPTNGTAVQGASGQVKGSKVIADRGKKQRDSKVKVRKLKYHQYIPPDYKSEREAPTRLDSTYSNLLHQQQLFLQLQIISQQQHSNYPTILPAPPRPPGDQQASSISTSSTKKTPVSQLSSSSTNSLNHHAIININIPPLPPNLDELKVAELKHELKIRALTVSGTKHDLIERLRNFHEQNESSDLSSTPGGAACNTSMYHPPPPQQQTVQPLASTTILNQPGNSSMVVAALPLVATLGGGGVPPAAQPQMMQFGGCSSCPPLSPAHSERSLAGPSLDGHICSGDAFEMVSSPLTQLSLQPSPPSSPTVYIPDDPSPAPPRAARGPSPPPPVDKERVLREKDRRIAELTRLLQQKQRQVERLRSQLQDRQVGGGACRPHPPIIVKEEPQDIPMEEAEDTQQHQDRPEELVLQQNQLSLHKQTPNRRKKNTKPQNGHTNSRQVSQLFISQRSGVSSIPRSGPKSSSAQSLMTDRNGNQFLQKPASHSADNRANANPQAKAISRVTSQRQKSTPSKLISQSGPQASNSDIQSKQQTICKQPLKKVLKPEKLGSGPHMKSRSSSFCSPSHVQPFFNTAKSVKDPIRCQREEVCVGVDQHALFTPPSSKLNSTPASRRKKSGRTQKIDDLFDILVQSGEISGNFKPAPDPALSCIHGSSPTLSPSLSPLHLSPPTPSLPDTPLGASSEEPPAREEFRNSSTIHGRLEDFLESTTGKSLTGEEPGGHVALIDELHSQLLNTPTILDHPPSPMDTYEFGLSSSRTGLELAESAMNSMDWLDLGIGGSVGDGPCTVALSGHTSGMVAPNGHVSSSVFSTDFLDSLDLQLHWDCY